MFLICLAAPGLYATSQYLTHLQLTIEIDWKKENGYSVQIRSPMKFK